MLVNENVLLLLYNSWDHVYIDIHIVIVNFIRLTQYVGYTNKV